MPAKKPTRGRSSELNDAFAAASASGDAKDWERVKAILLGAIASAKVASAIDALFAPPSMEGAAFDEEPMFPEVADAIVARASGMPAKEGSLAISWLATLSALVPTRLVSPNRDPALRSSEKAPFLDAVERHIDVFRTWAGDAAAERRVAGVHLLAWCANVRSEDLRVVHDLAAREKTASALASQLLTLGVMHHRSKAPADALRTLARAKLRDKSPLVRLCAAVALAFAGEVLSGEAIGVIVEHVKKPSPLPPQWGWRSAEAALTTGDLAAAVLPWAKTDDPSDAIEALTAIPISKLKLGAQTPIVRALRQLAFDARGKPVPRHGLALEEIDAMQRHALEAIATAHPSSLGFQGFGVGEARGLLRGDDPSWKSVPIVIDGKTHRWHYGRILGAVVYGTVERDHGVDALMSGHSLADVAQLASGWAPSRTWIEQQANDDERSRIRDFQLALLDRLRARGFDVDALIRDYGNLRAADIPTLAIAQLRAHPGAVSAESIELLAAAICARFDPMLFDLFRSLPETSQSAVLAATTPGGYTVPYFELRGADPKFADALRAARSAAEQMNRPAKKKHAR